MGIDEIKFVISRPLGQNILFIQDWYSYLYLGQVHFRQHKTPPYVIRVVLGVNNNFRSFDSSD